METKDKTLAAKFGLICGIVMTLCGIIITVISALDIDVNPTYRLVSGIVFIIVGILYMIISCRPAKR